MYQPSSDGRSAVTAPRDRVLGIPDGLFAVLAVVAVTLLLCLYVLATTARTPAAQPGSAQPVSTQPASVQPTPAPPTSSGY